MPGGQVSGAGFDTPNALAFDAQGNLYVSDGRNARVLRFSAPLGPSVGNPTANAVWGQSSFATRVPPQLASGSTITVPGGLAIDGSGNLYVATLSDNRVLVFSTATTLGGAAKSVLGQSDFTTTTANTGALPQASASSLSSPADVKVDANGNVFVADTSNNRVLEYPPAAKSGSRVWGQSDFVSNGPNQLKPSSLRFPYHMAIDYSSAPFALYVSDTVNHRVLVWKDSVRLKRRSGGPGGWPAESTDRSSERGYAGDPEPFRTSLSDRRIAVNPSDGPCM
jgi:sugar lactone lactonase YvrE